MAAAFSGVAQTGVDCDEYSPSVTSERPVGYHVVQDVAGVLQRYCAKVKLGKFDSWPIVKAEKRVRAPCQCECLARNSAAERQLHLPKDDSYVAPL
jgi:hypothetical protein